MSLEIVEALRPHAPIRSEPTIELTQRFGANRVQTPLGVDLGCDQSCVAQDPQVFGDERLAQAETHDQIADGTLATAQLVEDSSPLGLGEDREHRHPMIML